MFDTRINGKQITTSSDRSGFGLGESAQTKDKQNRSKNATFSAPPRVSSPAWLAAAAAAAPPLSKRLAAAVSRFCRSLRAAVFERLYAEAYKEPNFAEKKWENTVKSK